MGNRTLSMIIHGVSYCPIAVSVCINFSVMRVAKIVATLATATSGAVFVVAFMMLSSLYNTMEDVYREVMNGAGVFRYETDTAWEELIALEREFQLLPSEQYSSKKNAFDSIFRSKREIRKKPIRGLPSFCICEVPKIVCPPGPPGPAGLPGRDGRKCFRGQCLEQFTIRS